MREPASSSTIKIFFLRVMLAILFVPARSVERLQTNGLCNRPRRRFSKHSVVDEARYRHHSYPFRAFWIISAAFGHAEAARFKISSASSRPLTICTTSTMRFNDPLLDTAVDECSIFRG